MPLKIPGDEFSASSFYYGKMEEASLAGKIKSVAAASPREKGASRESADRYPAQKIPKSRELA